MRIPSRTTLLQRSAVNYGLAVVLIIGVASIRWAFDYYLSAIPYASFLPAVLVVAYFGGLGAGLFASALATVIAWTVLIPPRWTFIIPSTPDLVGLVLFAGISAACTFLIHGFHMAVERLSTAHERERVLTATLEQRVEERTREVLCTSERLAESERMFRVLVEGVIDYAIFMLDPDGVVISWNAGAERIKGYRSEEIIGRHFSQFYTEEDLSRGVPTSALRTATQTGKFESEGWRVRKDGTQFWASIVIDAIRDKNGSLIGFAKVTRDMTEKRHIEEQLRQALKMEAIGQLTGGIAHDFNNLLQVVMGNLESLHRRAAIMDPEPLRIVRRFSDGALRGAERAAALTRRLLAFSRHQSLDPKPTEVNNLISGMSELLHRTLGEKIKVVTVTDPDLWPAFVDGNHLESAVLNLAVNARDAMPNGGTLTIETANICLDDAYAEIYQEVQPGDYVTIAVSDTGTGMTKDVLDKIFVPFFTTKEPGRGTGLGLSQVYGFIKQSGGHVKMYSEPGRGTSAKLYVPCISDDSKLTFHEEEKNAVPTGTGEIVLLVEDDEDVRRSTAHMLRELGYGVVATGDGAEALREIAEQPDIRLLLTDVGLPGGMDGPQIADAVRAARPGLPILFTTAYARQASGNLVPFDLSIDILPKPFSYAALAAKVRQVLEVR